jgi:hypothetical protein
MTRAKLLVTICQIEWSRSLEYAQDDARTQDLGAVRGQAKRRKPVPLN